MASWTDDRVTRLKSLWLDGHSASAVARQLGGVTRNAVIGKVHRLGLSGRTQPSPPDRLKRAPTQPAVRMRSPARPVAKPIPFTATLVRAAPAIDPDTPRTPLLRLSACGCRFGLGDPRDDGFGFCGAPRVRGAYCAPHAEIAYQPPSPTRMKADRRLLEQVRRSG